MADHTRQGYCLRLSLDISLGWITSCFFSGFSSSVTVVRDRPGSVRESWDRSQGAGSVWEVCWSAMCPWSRGCAWGCLLWLLCWSAAWGSVASRRGSESPLCVYEAVRNWGRDGASECRCGVREKSDCRLRQQALRWVSFSPSPALIPTFPLSYNSLKSSLCVGSFFMPFSLSIFLPDLLFSPYLLVPSFQSPLLCFHPHASESYAIAVGSLNICSLLLWEPSAGRNCI